MLRPKSIMMMRVLDEIFSLQAMNTPHFIMNHATELFNAFEKKDVDNFSVKKKFKNENYTFYIYFLHSRF